MVWEISNMTNKLHLFHMEFEYHFNVVSLNQEPIWRKKVLQVLQGCTIDEFAHNFTRKGHEKKLQCLILFFWKCSCWMKRCRTLWHFLKILSQFWIYNFQNFEKNLCLMGGTALVLQQQPWAHAPFWMLGHTIPIYCCMGHHIHHHVHQNSQWEDTNKSLGCCSLKKVQVLDDLVLPNFSS